jgi:hypothetical protein
MQEFLRAIDGYEWELAGTILVLLILAVPLAALRIGMRRSRQANAQPKRPASQPERPLSPFDPPNRS